jgi:hypothetical protein
MDYKRMSATDMLNEELAFGYDSLQMSRQEKADYYDDIINNGTNPWATAAARLGRGAQNGVFDVLSAGVNLARLSVNTDMQAHVIGATARTLLHPLDSVTNAYGAVTNYLRSTPMERMGEDATRFLSGAVLTAGSGKVPTVVGSVVVDGGISTAKWLAPKAGEMVFNSMDRMGLVMRIVPDAPSMLPSGLFGNARTLTANMGLDSVEGYATHHLVMTSLARESSALRYLAENGLYDINRASNGLQLPTNDFLALADDLPLHRGFHGAAYRLAVRDQLTRLDAAYDAGLSDAQLLQRVSRIESSLSQSLTSGKLWLNGPDAALRRLGPFAP